MTHFTINHISDCTNNGIAREHDLCAYMGVPREKHDHTRYCDGSDIVAQGLNISVKSSRFSLMGGSLCEGREDFDSIWELYEMKVHSDTFAYITADYEVFFMNIAEFKQFVYLFCYLTRESTRNGGAAKIQCRIESKKMINWLYANAA